jgi:hypothetical protein
MYTIINKTKKTFINYKGDFPYEELIELLENDNDIIVVSRSSNTIKIPYLDMDSNNHGKTKSSKDWLFKDYYYDPYAMSA